MEVEIESEKITKEFYSILIVSFLHFFDKYYYCKHGNEWSACTHTIWEHY